MITGGMAVFKVRSKSRALNTRVAIGVFPLSSLSHWIVVCPPPHTINNLTTGPESSFEQLGGVELTRPDT